MEYNTNIQDLNECEKLVMFVISRIQKTPQGCFSMAELNKKNKIKKNNINLDLVMKYLIDKGLIFKGNKKDMLCVSHRGKIIEHEIEKENLGKELPYKVTRNRNNL